MISSSLISTFPVHSSSFSQNLSGVFPVLVVTNAVFCVGPHNSIGHLLVVTDDWCRFPCWVPTSINRLQNVFFDNESEILLRFDNLSWLQEVCSVNSFLLVEKKVICKYWDLLIIGVLFVCLFACFFSFLLFLLLILASFAVNWVVSRIVSQLFTHGLMTCVLNW